MTDLCSASVQAARELIISSSLLVIAPNKHEWTSESSVSIAERCQYTPLFKFKSTDVNLQKWQIQRYDWSDRLSIKLPAKGELDYKGILLYLPIIEGHMEKLICFVFALL